MHFALSAILHQKPSLSSRPPLLQGSYPAEGQYAEDFACGLRYQPELLCPSGSNHSSSVHRHSGELYSLLQIVPPQLHMQKSTSSLMLFCRLEHCPLLLEQVEEHCLCLFSTLSWNSVSPDMALHITSISSALSAPLPCHCRRQGLSSNLPSNHHRWSYCRCLVCLISDAPTASRQTAHTV